MAEKTKFRVSLCSMSFFEIEVAAENSSAAELIGRTADSARLRFECRPVVHKVEWRVPVPGQPGEFRWEEVERA